MLTLLYMVTPSRPWKHWLTQFRSKGCPKVVVHDLARCDMSLAIADAFRYNKLVLATTTYNADIYPFMRDYIHRLTERNFQNRKVALIENGSWAPLAAKIMKNMFEGSKQIAWANTTRSYQICSQRRKPRRVERTGRRILSGLYCSAQ